MYTVVPINITRSGEASLGSTISLNCSITSYFIIDHPLLLWRNPSGIATINSTYFTSVSGGRVFSSLVLQLRSIVTSDAGQYTCEVKGQSSGHQIATSKVYSVTIQSEPNSNNYIGSKYTVTYIIMHASNTQFQLHQSLFTLIL